MTKLYGNVTALSSLNLTVAAGETFRLLDATGEVSFQDLEQLYLKHMHN